MNPTAGKLASGPFRWTLLTLLYNIHILTSCTN